MEGPLETEGTKASRRKETLYDVLHRMLSTIFFSDSDGSEPLLQRIKNSLSDNGPLLKDATSNTGRKILLWTRRGSPLRALLVISVSTVTVIFK